MNKLSVIIAFLNEGSEVEITVEEFNRTAENTIDFPGADSLCYWNKF